MSTAPGAGAAATGPASQAAQEAAPPRYGKPKAAQQQQQQQPGPATRLGSSGRQPSIDPPPAPPQHGTSAGARGPPVSADAPPSAAPPVANGGISRSSPVAHQQSLQSLEEALLDKAALDGIEQAKARLASLVQQRAQLDADMMAEVSSLAAEASKQRQIREAGVAVLKQLQDKRLQYDALEQEHAALRQQHLDQANLLAARDATVKQLEARLEEAASAATAQAKEAALQAQEAAEQLQQEREQGSAHTEQLERELDRVRGEAASTSAALAHAAGEADHWRRQLEHMAALYENSVRGYTPAWGDPSRGQHAANSGMAPSSGPGAQPPADAPYQQQQGGPFGQHSARTQQFPVGQFGGPFGNGLLPGAAGQGGGLQDAQPFPPQPQQQQGGLGGFPHPPQAPPAGHGLGQLHSGSHTLGQGPMAGQQGGFGGQGGQGLAPGSNAPKATPPPPGFMTALFSGPGPTGQGPADGTGMAPGSRSGPPSGGGGLPPGGPAGVLGQGSLGIAPPHSNPNPNAGAPGLSSLWNTPAKLPVQQQAAAQFEGGAGHRPMLPPDELVELLLALLPDDGSPSNLSSPSEQAQLRQALQPYSWDGHYHQHLGTLQDFMTYHSHDFVARPDGLFQRRRQPRPPGSMPLGELPPPPLSGPELQSTQAMMPSTNGMRSGAPGMPIGASGGRAPAHLQPLSDPHILSSADHVIGPDALPRAWDPALAAAGGMPLAPLIGGNGAGMQLGSDARAPGSPLPNSNHQPPHARSRFPSVDNQPQPRSSFDPASQHQQQLQQPLQQPTQVQQQPYQAPAPHMQQQQPVKYQLVHQPPAQQTTATQQQQPGNAGRPPAAAPSAPGGAAKQQQQGQAPQVQQQAGQGRGHKRGPSGGGGGGGSVAPGASGNAGGVARQQGPAQAGELQQQQPNAEQPLGSGAGRGRGRRAGRGPGGA